MQNTSDAQTRLLTTIAVTDSYESKVLTTNVATPNSHESKSVADENNGSENKSTADEKQSSKKN